MQPIQHMFCHVHPFTSPKFTAAKNVKYINVRHVNMRRITYISQKGKIRLVNLRLMVLSKHHTLILGIVYLLTISNLIWRDLLLPRLDCHNLNNKLEDASFWIMPLDICKLSINWGSKIWNHHIQTELWATCHGSWCRSTFIPRRQWNVCAKSFPQYIFEHVQQIHCYGVNNDHKNGIDEHIIWSFSKCALSLFIHKRTHWMSGKDYTIWALAVHYAAYLYIYMPYDSNISPYDIFHWNIFTCHKFCTFHVWECLVYLLDPRIWNGQNLIYWQPKSRHGVFLGYSPNNSSDAPFGPEPYHSSYLPSV